MDASPLTGKALTAVRLPPASCTCYEGSVRSGKTFASLLDWLRFTREGPPGALLMTGRTERTIINNLVLPLQEWLGAARVVLNRGQGTVKILGREVLLVGADNESASTKIAGLTLAGCYCDEASALPETFFNMAYSRLSVAGARMWLTSNPSNPGHWLKTKWLDRAKLWIDAEGVTHTDPAGLDLHRVSFRLDDNSHLPPEYVARVKASYTGLWAKRYVQGQWVQAAGAVYQMWDPDRHVVAWDQLPEMKRVLSVGLDYGTTHPTAAEMLALGVDNRLYLVDEWGHDPVTAGSRWTDAQLSAGFRSWLDRPHLPQATGVRLERVCIDPAAASMKVQLYADGFSGLEDAENSVNYGIGVIASLLSTGRLLVSDRCQGFIKEVTGYCWDDKATAKGEDAVVKIRDDFCLVAGTLVTTARGQVPIERVHPGDFAWTRQGWRSVVDSWQTSPAADVVTLTTSDGRTLTGTPDHQVWVEGQGFTRLDALRYADILSVCPTANQSCSKASLTAATPTPRPAPHASTSPLASGTDNADTGTSTRNSGRPLTAPSLTGTTSTTSTMTHSTTTSQTWRASQPASTTSIMRIPGLLSRWLLRGHTLTRSGRSARLGTAVLKGSPGTLSMAARSWLPVPKSLLSVSNAVRSTSRYWLSGSAPTPASQRGAGQQGSMTRIGSAPSVARLIGETATARPFTVPVSVLGVRVEPGLHAVYDLTVEDAHEFYASGLLVHNCDAARYSVLSTETAWRTEFIDPVTLLGLGPERVVERPFTAADVI